MANYLNSILENPGLDHIAVEIFQNLDIEALAESIKVSKQWCRFIKENKAIWASKFPKKFPLHDACITGNTMEVNLLLTLGFDINAKDKEGETPLNQACQNQNVQIVEILCKQPGIDVNVKGKHDNPAIQKAIFSRWLSMKENYYKDCVYEIVKILCQHPKTDLNAKETRRGYTALHYACMKGHDKVVDLLCQQKSIDINVVFRYDETPLITATRYNREKVVGVLLRQQNIDINYQKDGGKTALHEACKNNNLGIVKLLCQHPNIDVNIQATRDASPLHLACERGSLYIFKILLEHPSINVYTRDSSGKTPIEKATENGHHEIVKYINANLNKANLFNPLTFQSRN